MRATDCGTLQLGGSRAARRPGGQLGLDLESRFQRLPGAGQIVDLWHAQEKLWKVSPALYGAGESAKQRAYDRCDDLEQRRFDDLLVLLRTHEAMCETAQLCVRYLETNRARMGYAEFRRPGLCIGSGGVKVG